MSKQYSQKKKIIIGLKKARTSLDRILNNLENNSQDKSSKSCFDVIQQNLAVIGLLKSVNVAMLEEHLEVQIDSIGKGVKQKRELKKMKEEVLRIVQIAQRK